MKWALIQLAKNGLSIRTQLVVLIIVAQFLAFALTLALIMGWVVGEERKNQLELDASDIFFGMVATIDVEGSGQSNQVISRLVATDSRFDLRQSLPSKKLASGEITAAFQSRVGSEWQDRLQVFEDKDNANPPGPSIDPLTLFLELSDGSFLSFRPQANFAVESFSLATTILRALYFGVPLVLLTVWASAVVVSPVASLSKAASRFANDAQASLLEETGPSEVRDAIRAFNEMQTKLQSMIETRAETLASISHDIRTPLTRLRLRLENIDLGEDAERIEQDIAAMETLTGDALAFLETESRPVALARANLTALCQSITDELSDQGQAVNLDTQTRIDTVCDIHLTLRAVQNVVENAVKYASGAEVSLFQNESAGTVEITISDQGPGIPDDLMETLLKPFNRVATVASGAEHGAQGFGLGLAIASECMKRQGGHISLAPNRPTGLVVSLRLPLRKTS